MRATERRRPRSVRCKGCKGIIKIKSKGRVPTYCSQTCRQNAYLKRRYTGPTELLKQDIATVQVRDIIHREVWDYLVRLGFTPEGGRPPKPKGKQPKLTIISGSSSSGSSSK
jgi:hypothetical protein